jgi:pimeloyl-ACP methyl ester carboxylesterase
MSDAMTAAKAKGREHWTEVKGQKIFLWQKRRTAGPERGTILFVHGSSMASTPTFDLQAPVGPPNSSVMDWFTARGFDTWCFDHRGYGRSYKGPEFLATIADGREDLSAVSDYILKTTNCGPVCAYGISSGAIRTATLAESHPERVKRLALDAYVYTGAGSPTLEQRRKKLDEWRSATRRKVDAAFLNSIFTRDHPGTGEDQWIPSFIEAVLALDDSIPNGTYIDMCANLPLNDPAKITAPTIIMRGEYDGIAGFDDLIEFFKKLPNPDKEFAVMPGISHASFQQKNHMRAYEILLSFFTRPEPVYKGH